MTVEVTEQRFAPEIEASAYFVVAEALTNVTKHSGAESADVRLWVDDSALHVEIRDDGAAVPVRTGAACSASPTASRRSEAACVSKARAGQGTRIAATLPTA